MQSYIEVALVHRGPGLAGQRPVARKAWGREGGRRPGAVLSIPALQLRRLLLHCPGHLDAAFNSGHHTPEGGVDEPCSGGNEQDGEGALNHKKTSPFRGFGGLGSRTGSFRADCGLAAGGMSSRRFSLRNQPVKPSFLVGLSRFQAGFTEGVLNGSNHVRVKAGR